MHFLLHLLMYVLFTIIIIFFVIIECMAIVAFCNKFGHQLIIFSHHRHNKKLFSFINGIIFVVLVSFLTISFNSLINLSENVDKGINWVVILLIYLFTIFNCCFDHLISRKHCKNNIKILKDFLFDINSLVSTFFVLIYVGYSMHLLYFIHLTYYVYLLNKSRYNYFMLFKSLIYMFKNTIIISILIYLSVLLFRSVLRFCAYFMSKDHKYIIGINDYIFYNSKFSKKKKLSNKKR